MASVREIAKKAGVSVTTVSRALNSHPDVNPKTRDLVMKAANMAGYGTSRRTQSSQGVASVALVQIDEASLLWEYDQKLLHGIQLGLHDSKYHLSLISLQQQMLAGESYSQFFMRHGFHGVILRAGTKSRKICEAIAAEGFPSVVVAERFEMPEVNYICCDSRSESERAIDHLVHLGHRRIALVVHRRADSDHSDRREGMRTL
ncbi:MAG: LacI family DNA-binding transcriptional regulator [Phycisphaerales bacterium]